MLLAVTSERESCDPEREFDDLYRRETVLLRGATRSAFSACFAECEKAANWLRFERTR